MIKREKLIINNKTLDVENAPYTYVEVSEEEYKEYLKAKQEVIEDDKSENN